MIETGYWGDPGVVAVPDLDSDESAAWDDPPEPEIDAAMAADQLSQGRHHRRAVDCDELMWIATWADLHPGPDTPPSLPGAERAVTLGGDGTPEVAEFCTAELAVCLGVSPGIGRAMMADVLDLRHRLPRLWRRVVHREVESRPVCRIAAMTRVLSRQAAALVDAAVVELVTTLPWRRLESIVWAKIIEADPELAVKMADARRYRKKVVIGESTPEGLSTVWACVETADAVWLDAMIEHLARRLQAHGAPGTLDDLRSRALGLLARPAEAIQLLAAPLPGLVPPRPNDNATAQGDTGQGGTGQGDSDQEATGREQTAGADDSGLVAIGRASIEQPATGNRGSKLPELVHTSPEPVEGHKLAGLVAESGWEARARLLPESGVGWAVRKWWNEVGCHQNNDNQQLQNPTTQHNPHDADPHQAVLDVPEPKVPGPSGTGMIDDPSEDAEPRLVNESGIWIQQSDTIWTAPPDQTGRPDEHREPAQRGPLPETAADIVEALREIPVEKLRPQTVLNVHVSYEALTAGTGVCRIDNLGPHVLQLVQAWLGRSTVRLNPVIDLPAGMMQVDSYEIPQRLRQHLDLRMPTSVFPWSASRGRLDLDHTQPYSTNGPPGQTRIGNLAPLARFEHRLVTHGRWSRRQPEPGTVLFRAPHGQILLVDPNGTHALADNAFAQHVWNAAAPNSGQSDLVA